MPDTINIYNTEVNLFLVWGIAVSPIFLQHRRPFTVVVDSTAPFVPRFLEQVVDASARKEVGSRVQGRHLLLQNQSRARTQTRAKKKKGTKVPRLRPESWRLSKNETK